MSSTKLETDRSTADPDIERRIRDFSKYTIEALLNVTFLIVLVGPLWLLIKAFSFDPSMPFYMRGICVVVCYIGTLSKNLYIFQNILAMAVYMLDIGGEKETRNQNLRPRSTDIEDWLLANFCVLGGISTIGFVAWYWVEVFMLTVRSLFYWTWVTTGLASLFWLLRRTIRFYRKVRGVEQEKNAWGILIGINALRFYTNFDGLEAEGVLGRILGACRLPFEMLKFLLDAIGFQIGRGPLFDRIPEEWKAERRKCKSWKEMVDFFAVFAGSADEHDDKEDLPDRSDTKGPCFPPSVFEWQPNPVMFPHRRDEHIQPPNFRPSVAENTSNCDVIDTAAGYSADIAVGFDDRCIPANDQISLGAPGPTGPAMLSAYLFFACPHCPFVAGKKYKVNKHVNRKHNHRFKCDHQGCGKTFGLWTQLERHEATHTGGNRFACPNVWCKIPGQMFTREDNLKRHREKCDASR